MQRDRTGDALKTMTLNINIKEVIELMRRTAELEVQGA